MTANEMMADWRAWLGKLQAALAARFPERYPALVELEQRMAKSRAERRCVQCGDRGAVETRGGGLVGSVKSYWFCRECGEHYAGKE